MVRDRSQVFDEMRDRLFRETDQLFAKILLAQWVFVSVLGFIVAPALVAWPLIAGGLLNIIPLVLIQRRSSAPLTRHSVAVMQMVWSALLMVVTYGREGTHFHVLGSIAILAFYRDWKILPTALGVIIALLSRGQWWPESTTGHDLSVIHLVEDIAWITFVGATMIVSCLRATREMKAAAARQARLERTATIIERKVHERTLELQESSERYRALVENTEAVTFEYDLVGERMLYLAPQASRLLECSVEQLEDRQTLVDSIHPDDRSRVASIIEQLVLGTRAWSDPVDCRLVTRRGRVVHVRTFLNARGGSRRIRAITLDVTRQRKLESELQQAQKLESVGRLAAGVAHEINTPIQFVGDSVQFMAQAIDDLLGVLAQQQTIVGAIQNCVPSEDLLHAANTAQSASDDADLQYLIEELPKAAGRALDGVQRVGTIVRSMKVFAHPDLSEMALANLNDAVKSTLTIARNEYRYVANVELDLGELPPVICYIGEINQVVLNIVINAAHAIGDIHAKTGTRGKIIVTTRSREHDVEISIRDTGGGIPEHVRDRIFDPFFTTKDVGKGSGQGLSIARSVIVDKHHGELTFETVNGVGTTFFVRIPHTSPVAERSAA